MFMTILCGIYLAVNCITDLRRQEIMPIPGLICMVTGVIWHMLCSDITLTEWLLGVGAGLVLAMISIATKEAIGLGDCLVVAVMGNLKGVCTAIPVFIIAVFISGIFAVMLYLFHTRKKEAFPFVPFLLAAYVLQTIGTMME